MYEYKLAILDWNGTLLNDFWLCFEVCNKIFKMAGKTLLTAEQFRDEISTNFLEFYASYGISKEEVISIYKSSVKENWGSLSLQTNVRPLLLALEALKVRMVILSGEWQDILEDRLKQFNLNLFFSFFENGLNKNFVNGETSDKKIGIEKILKETGISPEKTFYVDDMDGGIVRAKETGVTTFAYTKGLHTHQKLDETRPDFLIENHWEIIETLFQDQLLYFRR